MRPNFRPRFKKNFRDSEPRRRFLYEVQRVVVKVMPTLVMYKRSWASGRRPAERLVANYAARLV
jgi:hypothetical protein